MAGITADLNLWIPMDINFYFWAVTRLWAVPGQGFDRGPWRPSPFAYGARRGGGQKENGSIEKSQEAEALGTVPLGRGHLPCRVLIYSEGVTPFLILKAL